MRSRLSCADVAARACARRSGPGTSGALARLLGPLLRPGARIATWGALAGALLVVAPSPAAAQAGRGAGQGAGGAAPPPAGGRAGAAPAAAVPTARRAAPVDLTGYWVSVVSEDWAWRMFTPEKGDYASVPLNAAGRKVADTWTPAQDGSCKAYGAAGVLRQPGRLRISWQDDTTLKIETDAGQQTRLLHFGPAANVLPAAPATGIRTLQGHTVAAWMTNALTVSSGADGGASTSRPSRQTWASLKAVTTLLQPAWLRRNGVPYSETAVLTEYFDYFVDGAAEGAGEWFTVSTLVEDPAYLNMPFVISSNFRKEPDGANWRPTPCKAER
jgi:hypothetical protein